MTKPYQILLIPLTIWCGVEQGFFISDYTVGFISCIFGVGDVGWAFITYGVCDAIASLMFGYVVKYTGRISIYLLGAAINLVVIIIMFTYPPDHEKEYVFFILAGLWGIADGVWQPQTTGILSTFMKVH